MRSNAASDDSIAGLLRAYLDVVTLAEPLQGQIWAASQLTLTQVRVLRRVAREPRPLGQLAADLGLTPSSITRIVDRLEERGLVERRRDDADRRRVVAGVLPAGAQLATSLPQLQATVIGDAAARLPRADRERIAAAFAEFGAAVRALEAEPQEAAS